MVPKPAEICLFDREGNKVGMVKDSLGLLAESATEARLEEVDEVVDWLVPERAH